LLQIKAHVQTFIRVEQAHIRCILPRYKGIRHYRDEVSQPFRCSPGRFIKAAINTNTQLTRGKARERDGCARDRRCCFSRSNRLRAGAELCKYDGQGTGGQLDPMNNVRHGETLRTVKTKLIRLLKKLRPRFE